MLRGSLKFWGRWTACACLAGVVALVAEPAAARHGRGYVVTRVPAGISYWGSAYRSPHYYRAPIYYRAPVATYRAYVPRHYSPVVPHVTYYGARHFHSHRYDGWYGSRWHGSRWHGGRWYGGWPVGYYSSYYYAAPYSWYSPYCATGWVDPWLGVAPIGWFGNNENAGVVHDPVVDAVRPGRDQGQRQPLVVRADRREPVGLPLRMVGGQGDELARPAAARPAPAERVATQPGERLVDLGGPADRDGPAERGGVGRGPVGDPSGVGQRPLRALVTRVPNIVAQATGTAPIDTAPIERVLDRVAETREARLGRRTSVATSDARGESSELDRERAARYVEQGDELFARGRYLEAMSVYRKASSAAPDLAQPLVRQGFAYIAAGRYERAVESFRTAVDVDPNYVHSSFRLRQLYGGDSAARQKHVEALAEAALADATNAELPYLVGVFLHFDGQADRAASFFEEAARLAPADRTHVAAFSMRPNTAR